MSTTAKKTPAKKTTTAKRAAAAGAKAPADHQAKKCIMMSNMNIQFAKKSTQKTSSTHHET